MPNRKAKPIASKCVDDYFLKTAEIKANTLMNETRRRLFLQPSLSSFKHLADAGRRLHSLWKINGFAS